MKRARPASRRLPRLAALVACAAALACGVKAPPRPPENAGQAGWRRGSPGSGTPDAGAACGDAAACAPDGGAGRP